MSVEIKWIKYFASVSFFTCRECNIVVLLYTHLCFFLCHFVVLTGKIMTFISFKFQTSFYSIYRMYCYQFIEGRKSGRFLKHSELKEQDRNKNKAGCPKRWWKEKRKKHANISWTILVFSHPQVLQKWVLWVCDESRAATSFLHKSESFVAHKKAY